MPVCGDRIHGQIPTHARTLTPLPRINIDKCLVKITHQCPSVPYFIILLCITVKMILFIEGRDMIN
jgi:hypothetical protein